MITSRQNPLIKYIKSLADKKVRDELGVFTVEGVKSVNESIASGFNVSKIVGTESGLSQVNFGTIPTETVSDDVFKCISTDVSPQGVLAVLDKPVYGEISQSGNCIFLDGVSDPANVGAIIRTAAASGYLNVFIANGADAFSPKSVRASMGGIFRVRIYTGSNEILSNMIKMPFVIADMNGENVFDFKVNESVCIVIGNEANGVSEFMRNKATYTVKIPMENGMESLNAGVAAGILMYQLKK
ncbi:MAG: RNA methyltransferase [Clostridiales bacterium]|nr:RNA methyltransferase [Clostridiales bacterium]